MQQTNEFGTIHSDLEYARPANSALDGDRLVDTVLSLTAELLLARFGLTLDMSWVMELDSTTEIKLSRHLIVLIPGSAFASNAHVGAFVQELCALAESRREEQSTVAELFVKKVIISVLCSVLNMVGCEAFFGYGTIASYVLAQYKNHAGKFVVGDCLVFVLRP